MTAITMPDEEECYLLALLESPDGLDLAEFCWYDAESEDGVYRAWDFQWCAPGDTVLYTDQGRRRLDQVVGPVRLLTGGEGDRGRWADAEVRSFGQAWVWSIDLERRGVRRTLQFTAHHRHFAGAGRADRRHYAEKKTFELLVGDYLQPTTSPHQDFVLDREWVQAGVVFGDGTTVGNRSLVRLYGAKRELAQYFDVEGTEYPHHDARVPAVQVRNLPIWFKTRLPEISDKPSALWGWLAGYFATDGSVLPDGTCVLTSVDRSAMFHLRDVATALGIVVSAVGHRTRTTTMPNGYEHTSTELRVVLRASDLPLGFFLHPEHRQRIEARGEVRPRAVDAWRVTAIKPNVERVEVFCAVVPETGSFVLDGDILTGNSWYTDVNPYQADQGARACGKTVSITMRAFAFPFAFPGQKMLVTAPELNHLRPLVDEIEKRLLSNWLMREMLPKSKGNGINRQPHWQVSFLNDSQIISRLPGREGKGVKGQHVIQIELDEAQDYPEGGWAELVGTLNRWLPDHMWRVHGVPTGVRNHFWEITEGDASAVEDRQWRVHRPMAMQRPNWGDEERKVNTNTYGGSRQTIDYRRNIYGEHGDATHVVFVLHKLMGCVDKDSGSVYNSDVYFHVKIEDQMINDSRPLESFIQLPGTHKHGYEQWETPETDGEGRRQRPRLIGAKDGYSAYYAGADIGLLNHPTEILVFGQPKGTDRLELLTRIHLRRCDIFQHGDVVDILFGFYGEKLKAFGLDETGQGQGVFQVLKKKPYKDRIHGYNFSEKVIVGFEDRELVGKETLEDLAQMRNVVEHATDVLRNDYVDTGRFHLPMDNELLKEWQGQTWYFVKDDKDPYGKGRTKDFSRGKFHTLDAGKMMAAAKTLPLLEEMAKATAPRPPIIDYFLGSEYG